MRVLLVYSNQTRDLILPAPIGLSYVATATRRAGHEVRFVDLLTARDPHAALAHALHDFRPEAVGISVRNIDNLVHQRLRSHFGELARFVRLIRSTTGVTSMSHVAQLSGFGAALLSLYRGGRFIACHRRVSAAPAGESGRWRATTPAPC